MNSWSRFRLALVTLAASAVPAQAQLNAPRAVQLSGGPLVFAVRQGSDVEAISRTGTWWGAFGTLGVGRITACLLGMTGTLVGASTVLTENVRETVLSASYRLLPWLELGLEGEVVRLKSDLGTTLWRLYGARAGVTERLGFGDLAGRADLAVYPVTGVVAARRLRRPVRAEVGLVWTAPTWPVEMQLAYRVESIDFVDTNDLRLAGLMVSVAVRLGR